MPVARPALTEREPKKGERRVLIRASAVAVLAVHNLRLVRVQSQPDLSHPVSDRLSHVMRLTFAFAVHHGVVRVVQTAPRGIPRAIHDRTRSRVARGISPPGSHGTEREPLDSLRSSHPVQWYARIHAQ